MKVGSSAEAAFVHEGEVWALRFDDRVVRMKDAKGLRYIAALLRMPGREVHCLDLVQPDQDAARAMKRSTAGTALDEEARASYKQRLAEIDAELVGPGLPGDAVREELLRSEKDAILEQLSAAYGLGGRSRRSAADPSERARKAVTERVRTTLARIERVHPTLGRHLRRSIRTGAFCSYAPEAPIAWDMGTDAELDPGPSGSAIRVVVVDDHPLWRRTLRSVLEHGGVATVVGEASNGTEAVALTLQLQPDVVLMDIELGDMSGVKATAALIERGSRSRVLMLSSRDERDTIVDAVRCGADGYLLKTADADEITEAIRTVHTGDVVFPGAVAQALLAEIREGS